MGISLKNRHVLITGGSRGIGLETARQLAAAGTRLSLLSQSESRLESARQQLSQLAPQSQTTIWPVDLTDPAEIQIVFPKITQQVGPIDILIHAAGVFDTGPAESADLAMWDRMLDVNLKAAMHLSHLVLPDMLQAGEGAIIHIGSVAGSHGFEFNTAYCASKFGLRGFCQALFAEVRNRNILVSHIAPGMTQTDMTRGIEGAEFNKMIPVEEVSRAVMFVLQSGPGTAPVHLDIWPQADVFS